MPNSARLNAPYVTSSVYAVAYMRVTTAAKTHTSVTITVNSVKMSRKTVVYRASFGLCS
jgi:hypothetical protein